MNNDKSLHEKEGAKKKKTKFVNIYLNVAKLNSTNATNLRWKEIKYKNKK